MVQASHSETHWSRVLSLDHICSIEQILHFDVSKSIYPYVVLEGTGAQGGGGKDPSSHRDVGPYLANPRAHAPSCPAIPSTGLWNVVISDWGIWIGDYVEP